MDQFLILLKRFLKNSLRRNKLHFDKLLHFKFFVGIIKNHFNSHDIQFYLNDSEYYNNLSKIDFAFACSGTVHLELSFSQIPHFIFYKANWFNYLIFKLFVRSKYLSLINIFNKRTFIKEFIQSNFNHNNLINEFKYLFKNKDKFYEYTNLMIESLNNSNMQEIRSDIIIDYLKRFS